MSLIIAIGFLAGVSSIFVNTYTAALQHSNQDRIIVSTTAARWLNHHLQVLGALSALRESLAACPLEASLAYDKAQHTWQLLAENNVPDVSFTVTITLLNPLVDNALLVWVTLTDKPQAMPLLNYPLALTLR